MRRCVVVRILEPMTEGKAVERSPEMPASSEKEQKAPLKLNRPGRLELKKTVETGQVRQSFSHGRSKAVTATTRFTAANTKAKPNRT